MTCRRTLRSVKNRRRSAAHYEFPVRRRVFAVLCGRAPLALLDGHVVAPDLEGAFPVPPEDFART